MATTLSHHRVPWNKDKLVGQKAPLKLRDIWAIRVRLQLRSNLRDLALFNLAIDSKLRACDLLALRVGDIAHENHVNSRAVVMQRKTRRPVQFEITELSRDALACGARLTHPVNPPLLALAVIYSRTRNLCASSSNRDAKFEGPLWVGSGH